MLKKDAPARLLSSDRTHDYFTATVLLLDDADLVQAKLTLVPGTTDVSRTWAAPGRTRATELSHMASSERMVRPGLTWAGMRATLAV